MAFKRAERRRAYIKLAITGPAGSGKTYSALRLAFGLGSRVAMIDTENGSGSLYAGVDRDGIGEYDVQEIGPPFTVAKYMAAIDEAVRGGYDVLIIDSLSHSWMELLNEKEALDARGGNRFANWGPITKKQEQLKQAILQAPIHVIAAMRSKMEYRVDDNDKSAKPQKVGLAPIQRDGVEYEFTLVLDVASDHSALASKDRTGLFDGFSGRVTPDHGRMIAEWLASGKDPLPEAAVSGQQTADSGGRGKTTEALRQNERATSYAAHTGAAQTMPEAAVSSQACPYGRTADSGEPAGGLFESAPESTGDRVAAQVPVVDRRGREVDVVPASELVCQWDGCLARLSKAQRDLAVQKFGHPLCPQHQKEMAQQRA